MASPLSILRRSACPEGTKVATAVAELHRRWKNCDVFTKREDIERITKDYADMLASNGYPPEWRKKIFWKALLGYQRIPKQVDEGLTKRNRLGKETRTARRAKKLTGKST